MVRKPLAHEAENKARPGASARAAQREQIRKAVERRGSEGDRQPYPGHGSLDAAGEAPAGFTASTAVL